MYPTCHSSPPLSSSSTLQSPARASGVGGGDTAEAVAKASSRPAAAPSLPCRTRHCGKREVGGGGAKQPPLVGGPSSPTGSSSPLGALTSAPRTSRVEAAEVARRRRGRRQRSSGEADGGRGRLATAWTMAVVAAGDGVDDSGHRG
jgi:hypothetical protein